MKATDLIENGILTESKESISQVKLPFDRSALEPVLSKDALDYHYGKLYKAYVDKFNNKEGDSKFNKAGAVLHGIYFSQFQTPKPSNNPSGLILDFIKKNFKNLDNLKDSFENEAMKFQGSGWVYLAKDGKIKTIKNHAIKSDIVLLVDWWEHSWALDYQADKAKYLQNIWKIIDWDKISQRVI